MKYRKQYKTIPLTIIPLTIILVDGQLRAEVGMGHGMSIIGYG